MLGRGYVWCLCCLCCVRVHVRVRRRTTCWRVRVAGVFADCGMPGSDKRTECSGRERRGPETEDRPRQRAHPRIKGPTVSQPGPVINPINPG
jgi:hypothetical protein